MRVNCSQSNESDRFSPTSGAARRRQLFLMPAKRSHHSDAGEHRRPVMLGNQQQRLHRDLPFFGIVFCLGQLGDVEGGVAERDQAGGYEDMVLVKDASPAPIISPISSLNLDLPSAVDATGF